MDALDNSNSCEMASKRLKDRDAYEAEIERLNANLAAKDKALDQAEFWLTAALECKDWSWDADQRKAAEESLDIIRTEFRKRQEKENG